MKPEPVWILEAGGSLMVLSTTERDEDGERAVLLRAPIETVRAILKRYMTPPPTPPAPRRKPCPWFATGPGEYAARNHAGMIVLGTFPKHCPVCNGRPVLPVAPRIPGRS